MKIALITILLALLVAACSTSQPREAESMPGLDEDASGGAGDCKTIVIE